MKEKIIQGGIVNGEKMLVCPTWEDEFQKAIHKTGGCFRKRQRNMLLQIFRIWNIRRFWRRCYFHCSLSSLRRDWKELSGQSQPAIL